MRVSCSVLTGSSAQQTKHPSSDVACFPKNLGHVASFHAMGTRTCFATTTNRRFASVGMQTFESRLRHNAMQSGQRGTTHHYLDIRGGG
jgi:hypothetical protein